jgi:hypothetical protein
MSTIVTRAGKGSPLTNTEVDSNFTNLNTDKVESITSADGSVVVSSSGTTRDLSVGIAGSTATLISQVRNETGATLTKGTVVYISGAAGNKALVSKALATGDSTSAQTYGMVQADIPHNQNGYVVVVGAVSGLNTSAFADGTQLYLSGVSAGGYTNTKPYAPTHLVYVGIVTYSHNTQGTIQVKIQNGYELDEIHDVSARSPVDGQTLVYVSSTGLWTKTDQASMSVGSAATLATARNINGVSFNGSADITVADATKLPLAGGTLTGKLTLDGRNEIYGVPTNAGTIAGFMGGTSGGTSAARTQSLNTQTLLNVAAIGYTGSAWVGGAGLSFVATENITASNRGTKAVLTAIAAGDSVATTMEFNGSALTINGSTAVTSSNYNTYAPTKTGTGASGTWGINITGNAATATTLATARTISLTSDVTGSVSFNGSADVSITATVVDDSHNHTNFTVFGGVSDLNAISGVGETKFRPFTSDFQATNRSGSNYNSGFDIGTAATGYRSQFVFEANTAATGPKFRNLVNGGWGSWYELLHSANYNSYSPTLTGTGASGTWAINITGSAATATDSTKLPLTGGTLSGALTFSNTSVQRRISVVIDNRGVWDGTLNGYLLLAKAYVSGNQANSEVTGRVFLSRGDTSSGRRSETIEVFSKSAYQGENFLVNWPGIRDFSAGTLHKVTYAGTVYHAIRLGQSGGGPYQGFAFDGYTVNAGLIVALDSEVTNVSSFGSIGLVIDGTGGTILANAFRFYTGGSDGSTGYGDFRTNPATGNSIISAKTGGLYFNYDHGTGGVLFCNGAAGIVGTVDSSGNANFIGSITQNANQVLHAGNYGSYALPLSGGTIAGQLNVNNSGSATAVMRLWSAGSTIWSVGVGDSSGTNFNISADFGSFLVNKSSGNVSTPGQFYAGTSNLVLHAGNYTSYALKRMGTGNNNIDSDYGEGSLTFDPVPTGTPPLSSPNIRTLNLGDNFARRTQLAFNYATDQAWFRRRNDGGWNSWREFIHDGNYSSYALPLTGGTLTGITLIKRNLGTNDYTIVGQHNLHLRLQRSSDLKTLELGVLDNGTGVIQANEAGVGYQTLALNPVAGGVTVNGQTVLTAGNYNSYAPTLTGGGASGTWGINITGNAATATSATTATRLTPINTTSTSVSTWNPGSLTYQAWGQSFAHTSISSDSGDLTLWLRPSQYTGGGTELNMYIDGDYYSGTGVARVLNASNYTSYALPLTGGTLSGNILFSNSGTTKRGIQGTVGDNDFWFVGGGATASNAGFMEIASGDDAATAGSFEPIYVSQYLGDPLSGTLQRRGSLLDASGNTSFPGTISASSFAGSLATGSGASGTWAIKSRSINAVRTVNSNFNDFSTAVDTFTAGTNYIPSGGGYNQPVDGDHHYLAWGGIEGAAQWAAQIDINFYDDRVWFRRQSNTSWQAWRQFIHDGNYNSYAPTLTGGGASGTWGINITGTASGETLGTVTGRGGSTSSAVTLASGANHYQGHFYYDSYDAAGNHYPHFTDGGNASGVKVNWRLYTGGTNSITHYWGVDTTQFVTKLESTVRVDAPVFYDRNDTGFYADFNNTGVSVNAAGVVRGSYFVASNYGATGYTQYKGYDNNNHFIVVRGYVGGTTTTPSITGGHGTTFVEYAEGNDSTGWFFRTAATGNYDIVSRITRSYSSFEASVRSPLFYDSDNTGFYTNPAGSSYVNNIDANFINIRSHIDMVGPLYSYRNDVQTILQSFNTSAGNPAQFNISHSYGNTVIESQRGLLLLYGSASQANNSFRAPIFYDSNDTGYYTDPNGVSNVVSLYAEDSLVRIQKVHVEGGEIRFLNTAQTTGGWIQGHDGGLRTVDHAWTQTTWNIDNSGNSVATSSHRAPVFYDSNDTSRYLDPNGTSILGGLFVAATASTGRSSYGSGTANLVLYSESTYGRATIDFRSGVNYPSDGAQIYYETATNLSSGETSRLVIRTENDADDGILIRGGYIIANSTTVDGGSSNPGFQTQYNGTARLYTYSDNTSEAGSFRAPIFYDSNDTGYYVDPNTTGVSVRVAGNITAYYSDMRLKTHLGKIENAREKVRQLEGFYYEANELAQSFGYKPKREVGVSAQAVQAVLPEIVTDAPINSNYLTIDYERLTPLLIEAVKEQDDEILELRARVAKLEALVSKLIEG